MNKSTEVLLAVVVLVITTLIGLFAWQPFETMLSLGYETIKGALYMVFQIPYVGWIMYPFKWVHDLFQWISSFSFWGTTDLSWLVGLQIGNMLQVFVGIAWPVVLETFSPIDNDWRRKVAFWVQTLTFIVASTYLPQFIQMSLADPSLLWWAGFTISFCCSAVPLFEKHIWTGIGWCFGWLPHLLWSGTKKSGKGLAFLFRKILWLLRKIFGGIIGAVLWVFRIPIVGKILTFIGIILVIAFVVWVMGWWWNNPPGQ